MPIAAAVEYTFRTYLTPPNASPEEWTMTKKYRISRRNFLTAAAAAGAVPAVMGSLAWAKPRKLKPVPDATMAKIEEALPKKATAKPAKSRKILIFCLCEGFFHGSIPTCNAALKLRWR